MVYHFVTKYKQNGKYNAKQNTQGAKKGEANQKQQSSDYTCD